LPRAFARGHYTPRDIAISDHADGFQVLLRFDYSNLATLVLGHHLGCLLHIMLRRAARKIGANDIFGLLDGFAPSNYLPLPIARSPISFNKDSHFERLWRVTDQAEYTIRELLIKARIVGG